jgi:phenylacetate-CoA ligase
MSVAAALRSYREQLGPQVLEAMGVAEGRVAALRARLDEAGVDLASGPVEPSDLDAVAVLSKDALPALQKQRPPFGGLVANEAAVVRIFASPGPIYEAQLEGPDPWRWMPALSACGIGVDDIVLNCFGYHLSPAGAMFDEACRAVGASVIPGGVGASEVQAQMIADVGVTAYIGLPSYLAALVEKYDSLGLDARSWRVAKALVTAEPLPDPLRTQLTKRVPTVLMAYGTAEAGLLGYETSPGGGLTVPPGVYVQICDPTTGIPVEDDEPGEVVISLLHDDYPLLRFGTGDVSRWQLGPDGTLRLAGVLGRVGAAVKVRGMFVHPHQARDLIGKLAGLGVTGGRFVVERLDGKDVLRLELVTDAGAEPERVVAVAAERTREQLRVRPRVELVTTIADEDVLRDARA